MLSSARISQKRVFRSGQTLVEYALILAFTSIVAIVVLQNLGSHVSSLFQKIDNQLDAAQSAS